MIGWISLLSKGPSRVFSNTVWITTNSGKFLKKCEYQTTLTVPWNLNADLEATVRTWHGTPGWFKIGKGVWQGCILSPYLFNLYAEYFMWNASVDESQARIKMARRNINNLIYVDTTLMAKSEEEQKNLLMRVKEKSDNACFKLNMQKTKIMLSGPIISWQIEGVQVYVVTDIFLGSKITMDSECRHEIKRCLFLGRKAMTNLDNVLRSRDITLPRKTCIGKTMFFSSIHVRFWKLNHKEGWALKNWCFLILVVETFLESPLDSKEIKSVNPKGSQPWIFIGRTDAEAEAPVF